MDIEYGDGASYGKSKYVLVLFDQCTIDSFINGMQGSLGADICEELRNFLLMLMVFPRQFNVILTHV